MTCWKKRHRSARGCSAACGAIWARRAGAVSDALKSAVYVGVDRRLYEQTEEMLIAADVGVDGTVKIVDELEQRCDAKKIETVEPYQNELADVVAELLSPADPELQRIDVTHQPTVILMVGVNGTGKTTTIGKLAWRLKEMGKTPLMVAGDTFRAAAVEQLSSGPTASAARS